MKTIVLSIDGKVHEGDTSSVLFSDRKWAFECDYSERIIRQIAPSSFSNFVMDVSYGNSLIAVRTSKQAQLDIKLVDSENVVKDYTLACNGVAVISDPDLREIKIRNTSTTDTIDIELAIAMKGK